MLEKLMENIKITVGTRYATDGVTAATMTTKMVPIAFCRSCNINVAWKNCSLWRLFIQQMVDCAGY